MDLFECYIQYSLPVASQEDSDEGVVIEGYASTKDLDRQGDIVEPTAFAKSLDTYMANPVVLFNHKRDIPIGKTLSATIDDIGLKVKVLITDSKYVKMVRDGVLNAFSWVGRAKGYVEKLAGKDVRHITEADLYEISGVSVPANAKALFQIAKSLDEFIETTKETNEMTPEEMAKALADSQAALLKAMGEAIAPLAADIAAMKAAPTPKVEAPEEILPARKGLVDGGNDTRFEAAAFVAKGAPISEAIVFKAMQDGHASDVIERLAKNGDEKLGEVELTAAEKRVKGQLTAKALRAGMAASDEL